MRSARVRLRLEALENRQLLTTTPVHIDSTWIRQANGGPLYLTQANTPYILDVDVDVPGTAIVVGAANVSLDLNGHRVTYGDSAVPVVTNGGFELGGWNSVPGWDLSRAPSATRVPAITGAWGQWMLQLNHFTTTQTLVSDPVAIPTAFREYAAAITPKGTYDTTVRLSVIDAVTGAVLGTGTSVAPDRGFSALATFTPTTTHAVRLQVDLTPSSGSTATMALDYAAVVPSRDFGIVATQNWTGALPVQLVTPQFQAVYRAAANFSVTNGQVNQGQGHGYQSSALYFNSLPGFTVNGVTSSVNGLDTGNVDGSFGSNAVIANSTFQGNIDRITNRMRTIAAIGLANFDGTASVTGNHIVNSPQEGILFNGVATQQSLTITNNDIRQNAIVTDGYGILIAGVRNFDIGHNTIAPIKGRGILVDGWGRIATENGRIHDNNVNVYEEPNLEYNYTQLEATGLRIRNYDSSHRNLTITNNTFLARTGPGGDHQALSARITEWNNGGQTNGANNLIQNNIFKAIVTTADPNYSAQALSISNVGAGTGLQIINNVLESNDTSLNFGDTDSWTGHDDDISMGGNALRISNDGPRRNYSSIVAGGWLTEVSNIRLPNTYLENGAPATVVYAGDNVTNLQVDWHQGPSPAGDSTGGTGASFNNDGGGGSGGDDGGSTGWPDGYSTRHLVFAIQADGQVWSETSSGYGVGSGWVLTQPGRVKAISVATDRQGHSQVFAIGLDNQVWTESQTPNGQWYLWSLPGDGAVKALSAVMDAAGRPQVYAIGLDNQVWTESIRSNGWWSGWSLTRGGAVKSISAVTDAAGRPEVFAIGLDNQVWTETSSPSGGWNGWTLTHGGAVKALAAVIDTTGHPQVFAIGLDDQVWSETGSGNQWNNWTFTRTGTMKSLTAVADAAGHPEIFAIGTDDRVWTDLGTGIGQWNGWSFMQDGGLLQMAG